jgi:RNA polymerase sigma-70 factor, ECF subfamily
MDRATESLLIDRAVAGDSNALERLLNLQHAPLLKFITRQLPPALRRSTDPADIVQQTHFEACRLIRGFVPDGKKDALFRWLATIARHRMINLLDSASVRREAGEDEADGMGTVVALLDKMRSGRRTPSKSAAAHELMLAIESSIRRLPNNYRRVITLRHVEGLSAAETAAEMNESVERIYWLCSRALHALRAEFKSDSSST